jgi:ADP-ribosylglycohydrolase
VSLQPFRGLIEAAVKSADEVAAAGTSPDAVLLHAQRFGNGPELFKCVSTSIFLLLSGGKVLDATRILRDNIRLGGDSCARGVFLGALLGAAMGVSDDAKGAIPVSWANRVTVRILFSARCARF